MKKSTKKKVIKFIKETADDFKDICKTLWMGMIYFLAFFGAFFLIASFVSQNQ